ncbi:MAG TPA: hypothetical protein PLQ78_02955 [Flavipsychrobacter sp.]|nr:hypothetical protein [Flavipsychrobacter sp.]
MKKLLFILFICFAVTGWAQQTETYTSSGKPVGKFHKQATKKKSDNGFDLSRMIYGGNIGGGGGNGAFSFNIAPVIGYRITDKFAAGVGFGYQYAQVKDYFKITDLNGMTNYFDFKAGMLSTSVWARYLILPKLFVHAAYEHNFTSFQNYRFARNGSGAIEGYKEKYNSPSALVGIGYRAPVGNNVSMYVMGMVDVLQLFPNAPQYSPYYYDKSGSILNAIYPSIGFTIGF